MNSRSFACEVLETVKIRPSRLIQSYNFAVDNSVSRKIVKRLSDLWESFVEVLVVPRVQDRFGAGSNLSRTVAVELNFVGSIWPLAKRRNQCAFHRLDEVGFSF